MFRGATSDVCGLPLGRKMCGVAPRDIEERIAPDGFRPRNIEGRIALYDFRASFFGCVLDMEWCLAGG